MDEDLQSGVKRRSLPEQVAEVLRTKVVAKAKPGQRLDAEPRLAKRLGVSVPTLRQALSVLAQQGLVERHQGRGTFVTAQAHQQFVAIAARVAPSVRDSDYQARLFHLVDSLLRERGLHTRHYWKPDYPEAWADFREDIAGGRLSGVAFIAMAAGQFGESLRQHAIPFISPFDKASCYVLTDYAAMARDGARYLVERGCRRIAFMQMPGDVPASFRDVLAEAGLPAHKPWLRSAVFPRIPGAGWEQFRDLWAARDEKPDGLLVLDDVLFNDVALGILDSHIQVPEQLQIVTHANQGSGFAYPFPVTRLEIDPCEVAEAMVAMLVQLMQKETVREQVSVIRARLIPAAMPQSAEPKA